MDLINTDYIGCMVESFYQWNQYLWFTLSTEYRVYCWSVCNIQMDGSCGLCPTSLCVAYKVRYYLRFQAFTVNCAADPLQTLGSWYIFKRSYWVSDLPGSFVYNPNYAEVTRDYLRGGLWSEIFLFLLMFWGEAIAYEAKMATPLEKKEE